ncbi:MAG: hypothetical protein GY880_19165, partial [Planctomycetaceae bacterium]|nr:hypothetical protein [Planctomycetaceae bacterium]
MSESRATESESTPGSRPSAPEVDGGIDLSEKGRGEAGKPVSLNRRLFMQFMGFRNGNIEELAGLFENASAQAVIYQDIHDASGFGVLAF